MTELYIPTEGITLHIGDVISFEHRKTGASYKEVEIKWIIRCEPQCYECVSNGYHVSGSFAYCPTAYKLITVKCSAKINKIMEV